MKPKLCITATTATASDTLTLKSLSDRIRYLEGQLRKYERALTRVHDLLHVCNNMIEEVLPGSYYS